MSNCRAYGKYGLTIEMIKHCDGDLLKLTLALLEPILLSGKVPGDWKLIEFIMVVKLLKTSSPHEFRPIAFLQVLYTVVARLHDSRVSQFLSINQPSSQVGSRKGVRIEEHLVTREIYLRLIHGFQQEGLVISLGFQEAFDRIQLPELWSAFSRSRST